MNKRRKLHWQNVTGGVDEHENFQDAAIREAIEETNISQDSIKTVLQSDLEYSFKDQWGENIIEKVFFLKCHGPWEVKIDPNEHQDFKWVVSDDINEDSVHYQSNYIALKEAIELKCC